MCTENMAVQICSHMIVYLESPKGTSKEIPELQEI